MIKFDKVKMPKIEQNLVPVTINDESIELRKKTILDKMKQDDVDAIVVFADLEHGNNFEYLVGFLPRFEEAMLVMHQTGEAYVVLGNENLNKASKSRIEVKAVHMPHFSLPNQPMKTNKKVSEILAETNIGNSKKIGLIGWKNFTSMLDDNSSLYDIPYFIVDGLKEICPNAKFVNTAYMFIGENGARNVNNANEFAHYEFGAALAGNCMLETLNYIDEGMTEMDAAEKLAAKGQRHSVVTIMATGARFENANMYPGNKVIKKGDPLSITTGFKGGLQSRAGYAVENENELDSKVADYLEKVANPYFSAVTTWLESIKVGMKGKELYDKIEEVLPKEKYGWSLNPGHLCADEEWLSSPIYQNSEEKIKSGMLFQIDIIPSVSGYCGISCESGVLIADEKLQAEIKTEYPDLWTRIEARIKYIKEELGINLGSNVLPTSNLTAFTRPFLLNKTSALKNV